jgi:hypothetical protein
MPTAKAKIERAMGAFVVEFGLGWIVVWVKDNGKDGWKKIKQIPRRAWQPLICNCDGRNIMIVRSGEARLSSSCSTTSLIDREVGTWWCVI